MNAFEHASYCRGVARDLYREFQELGYDVVPVFHSTATYTWFKDSTLERDEIAYYYVHPEDLKIKRIEDFKYPHREL